MNIDSFRKKASTICVWDYRATREPHETKYHSISHKIKELEEVLVRKGSNREFKYFATPGIAKALEKANLECEVCSSTKQNEYIVIKGSKIGFMLVANYTEESDG